MELCNQLKRVVFKIYQVVFMILGYILPKKKNQIIFESFLGKQYSDNPRAIYEYLEKNYPEYTLYWSVERNSLYKFNTLNVNYIRRFSFKWMITMNRSKYWVTNSRLPLWIPKPKKVIYIQTWHGTPLKRLADDMEEVHMPGTNTQKYKENFLKEAQKWDYLISPNAYSTEIFKRAFKYDREIIEVGYPRNDYLILNNNQIEIDSIKRKANLPLDKKIILYAPTWRDNQFYGRGRYKFDISMDLEKMQKELSSEYVILLRMHYLVAENIDISKYSGFIYDYSYYEDIRELYLISDILITDYSSVFFDFANLKKPMLFYVYDLENYRDNLRGFYFDFEKQAPGPLVKTTDELLIEINNLKNEDGTNKRLEDFYNKFCYLEDGRASERVMDKVFQSMK